MKRSRGRWRYPIRAADRPLLSTLKFQPIHLMKFLILSFALSLPSFAAYETWTNKEGKEAKLEFVKLTEKDGEKAAEFKMSGGRRVTIKASDLSEDDAKRLDEAAAKAAGGGVAVDAGVFAEFAAKGLVKLVDGSVNDFTLSTPPTKYYLLYYSASWCGPCRMVTPELVKWYNTNKSAEFELIFVSNDRDEKSMEGYLKDDEMPWPAFSFSTVRKEGGFGKYRTGGGIPHLVVLKTDGTVVTEGHPAAMMGDLKKTLK
jgi:nucleoredoxin